MTFSQWLFVYDTNVQTHSAFVLADLREAWLNDKNAQEVAKANDALVAEYGISYQQAA